MLLLNLTLCCFQMCIPRNETQKCSQNDLYVLETIGGMETCLATHQFPCGEPRGNGVLYREAWREGQRESPLLNGGEAACLSSRSFGKHQRREPRLFILPLLHSISICWAPAAWLTTSSSERWRTRQIQAENKSSNSESTYYVPGITEMPDTRMISLIPIATPERRNLIQSPIFLMRHWSSEILSCLQLLMAWISPLLS